MDQNLQVTTERVNKHRGNNKGLYTEKLGKVMNDLRAIQLIGSCFFQILKTKNNFKLNMKFALNNGDRKKGTNFCCISMHFHAYVNIQ